MGAVDVDRQALNVFRMKLLGSEVESVQSGSRTLKDAVNEAMRDWVATVETTHYCLGSVMGPHPYPWMVREFHRVVGEEANQQCRELIGDVPDVVVACVGGGSNAIGIFSGFVDERTRLVGVEPAGGAAVGRGQPGVVHGMLPKLVTPMAHPADSAPPVTMASHMIGVQMCEHDVPDVVAADPAGAQLRPKFFVGMHREPGRPAIERMPARVISPLVDAGGFADVDEDQSLVMLDDPGVNR